MTSPQSTPFEARLVAAAAMTEECLDRLLSGEPAPGEIARPQRLLDAMRYASLGGGKRLRPFLVIETAALFGKAPEQAMMTAAALECIHCYSLVHDDLPAMDDDALRRGRPTAHKAFDEATAILAGDGLLTFAFDLLARPEAHPDPGVRIRLVQELARASGIGGMAGGQMLDLAAEGRFAPGRTVQSESDVAMLDRMKTGALLRFATRAGAILGEAPAPALDALDRFGRVIGEAFQIADDLLDVEGDPSVTGKATGKDEAAGKATLVSIVGVSEAKARLADLVAEADAALDSFAANAAILRATARYIVDRRA
jgi:farnesyl diphosphate synthase